MRFVLPVLFCISLAASVLVYFAAGMLYYSQWARSICAVIGKGCDHPWFIYAGTASLLVLALLQREFRS
jgi:hypothetical protein